MERIYFEKSASMYVYSYRVGIWKRVEGNGGKPIGGFRSKDPLNFYVCDRGSIGTRCCPRGVVVVQSAHPPSEA